MLMHRGPQYGRPRVRCLLKAVERGPVRARPQSWTLRLPFWRAACGTARHEVGRPVCEERGQIARVHVHETHGTLKMFEYVRGRISGPVWS